MGCKRFFLKDRKNVIFLNKINLPYCFVVFFVVCSRLRPFLSVFGELALFWCSAGKTNAYSKNLGIHLGGLIGSFKRLSDNYVW